VGGKGIVRRRTATKVGEFCSKKGRKFKNTDETAEQTKRGTQNKDQGRSRLKKRMREIGGEKKRGERLSPALPGA